jgi:hypothetical protein
MNNSQKTIKQSHNYDQVLKLISRYRYVTIAQLQAILGLDGYQQARKILFDLCDNGYLERLVLTRATQKITYRYVFALSRKGARQLLLSFGLEKVSYLRSKDQRSTFFLDHTLLINDFRICLEGLQRRHNDFELTSWKQSKQQVKVTLNTTIQ